MFFSGHGSRISKMEEDESFSMESWGNNKSVGEEEEMRQALRRVKLPNFDGSDPIGWPSKSEQYFEIQGTPTSNKVLMAVICMEGGAMHWCQ